jgi:hypothetical protein
MKAQTQIPTLQPVVQPPTPDQWMAAQTFVNAVWVPFIQNAGGGLGAFILALIGLTVVMGEPLAQAAKIALVIAGIIFGIAMVVRSFRDEVKFLISVWADRHNAAERAQLEANIQALSDEIVRLKSEALPAHRYETLQDAERLLLDLFKSGLALDRRSVLDREAMTRPRWERASGMLRNAGVLDRRGNVRVETYAVAMASVVHYSAASTTYVKTADDDWAKS